MLQLLPIIIISSTIPLQENIIMIEGDYSVEAYEYLHRNDPIDSQDTDSVLYNLILEQLLIGDRVDNISSPPTMK